MIIWCTGQSGSGKSVLAQQFKNEKVIILDGDKMREVWNDLDLSEHSRRKQGLRVARLARELERQGFIVVVAVIAPYKDLRDEIYKITNCNFIYLKGGKIGKEYPYEYEDCKLYWHKN